VTARERIEAVLNRERPDRVPWSPMLGDSYLRSQPRYLDLLTPEQREAVQNSYRYASLVPLPSELGFQKAIDWQMVQDVGGDIVAEVPTAVAVDERIEVEARPGEDEQTTFVFHTRWGDLQEVVAGSGSAETVYRVQFAISERAEYDVMAQVIEHRRYAPCPEQYEEEQQALGERGACIVRGPDQPLVSLFRVRDPMELVFDLADEPDRMEELLALLHARALEGYRLVAQGPGKAVLSGMAFITTQLISPRLFERHVLPYLAEYARVLHEGGKVLLCHMCGHIQHLLPMLREAKIDGLDSLTNPPVGDTTLSAFWEALGDDAILMSGIDAELLLRGTPDQVRAHTQEVLERAGGRALILRSADEVSFGTPMENLLAVADVVREAQAG